MKYRLFGHSGLRVSELCLGTMGFGTEWKWGTDRATSQALFDQFAQAGGNFYDTANIYTEGTSEKYLGEFIASDRDRFVVATKYSLRDRFDDVNFAGNHRKNLMRSVEGSLRRLGTDYIDLLWLHAWDATTPVEEVMRGFEDLVASGKVHYIGISDTPAWVVSQANMLAQLRGWAAFVGLQIEYSLLQRTPERDLLPMAQAWGMAITPWGALGGGALSGKYLRGEVGRLPAESVRRGERAVGIAQVVAQVAEAAGLTPAQVAYRWTMQRPGLTVIPIVGATKPHQLADSLKTVDVQLAPEHLAQLDEVSQIELGFPHEFLASEGVLQAFGNSRQLIVR
jgi:aryl-alcohol dehydrogenase-like predicted oxidoreductase